MGQVSWKIFIQYAISATLSYIYQKLTKIHGNMTKL